MAVLRARRDDSNATPGDVVFTFLQALHLVLDCRASGLRQVRMFGIYLQWDLHKSPFIPQKCPGGSSAPRRRPPVLETSIPHTIFHKSIADFPGWRSPYFSRMLRIHGILQLYADSHEDCGQRSVLLQEPEGRRKR
jgi:hypothetical protein